MDTIRLYCKGNTIVLERQGKHSVETTNDRYTDQERSTREQILSAATRQFAEHGFRGASIRGIASAAGVSPGLVQHHFGTKDGLREACDERVMALMKDTQFQFLQRGAQPIDEEMAARLEEFQPVIDYLIMSLSSGSAVSAKWFQEITEYTHDALTSGRIGPALDADTQDTWAIAATQAAMALGITAFYRTIQEILGDDDRNTMLRVGQARLFLASDQILGDETRTRLQRALEQYAQSTTTGKPPPSSEPANGSSDA